MPHGLSLLVSLLSPALAQAATSEPRSPALMPLPRSMTSTSGTLDMAGRFEAAWSGCGDRIRLDSALKRLNGDVMRQTGLVLDANRPTKLTIKCRASTWSADHDEGYRLTTDAAGVRVEADGPAGVLRSFATLRQLVGLSPDGIRLAFGSIDDAPRFAWRGLMIDVVRHFMSANALKRQIDAMERVKLNVLHISFSNDQGFRVESRRFPRLTADQQGQFYTQGQIRDLVRYADERGVRIVPEFNVPGHSRAITTAYPALGVVRKGPLGLPVSALNPAAPQTYRFVTALFGEMAGLFPDRYFHVGGDEVAAGVWDDDPMVGALKRRERLDDTRAVEAYFHRRVHRIVAGLGKTVVGWDEIAGYGLPRNVVIQNWRGSNGTATIAASGHPVIVSAGYYLDLLMPADWHYAKDPLDPAAAGLAPDHATALRHRSPLLAALITDQQVAFSRPPLTAAQAGLVRGAEACLWTEIVTEEMLDARLWPRTAALAERFWSSPAVRDPASMYRRLAVVSDQLRLGGLQDDADQARMTSRFASDDPGLVGQVLAITGPVRNMAHDHSIKAMLAGRTIVQAFNAPADAAPVDSLTARLFTDEAQRYAAGDKSPLPSLRAKLTGWRDIDTRYAAASTGHPLLEAARPTARQIGELASIGLAAIDAIEAGKRPTDAAAASWQAQLAIVADHEAASFRPFDAFLKSQPPADLIVKIGPGVQILVKSATAPRE